MVLRQERGALWQRPGLVPRRYDPGHSLRREDRAADAPGPRGQAVGTASGTPQLVLAKGTFNEP